MELPMQIIIANYPNAAPNEVETMVTKPIEQQVAAAQNLSGMTSYSMDGTSIVIAQFESGTDMNFAGLDIREKVELISDYLPDSVSKPMVIAMNPDMLPVEQIYISGDMDLTQLNTLVEDNILQAFERVEGVASVNSFGGKEDEIAVEVDQSKLDGYHLTLMQIQQALAAENISLPSGEVKKGSRDMIVRTVGDFETVEDVKNVSLPLPTNEIVHIGDVAEVVRREKEQTTIGRVDGSPAIGIAINKQTVANTVQVADRINIAIDNLEKQYPQIKFTKAMDQSEFVRNSINFVAESAIMGCILAILICLFFLRSIASTMIIAISIPTSIVATFILMYFAGFTMNMLSLSGLAVGIGMLVDDSIVVMENVFRRRAGGLSPRESAIRGASEVTMPVFAATMTKIAVFLPIVFVEGIAATIFKEFSFTISFALACSLIVALTVIPMLCSRLIKIGDISDLGVPELEGADL
jgi:HAE1 family hydrophobic/amphiphilic exporter-1